MASTQKNIETPSELKKFIGGNILCEPPNLEIYDFTGVFRNEDSKEPLTLENTMWQNTVLAS